LSVLDCNGHGQLDTLRGEAETVGIEIATIAGYTDFTAGRGAAEVPLVEMQVAYVHQLARMAARLGAKIVRVFSGYSPAGAANEANWQADWNKCVAALREAATRCADEGIML